MDATPLGGGIMEMAPPRGPQASTGTAVQPDVRRDDREATAGTFFRAPGPDSAKLGKVKTQWQLEGNRRLRNNLMSAVGFLELANAGDFAANIWNQVPVPVYAVVFMVIGGTVAGVLSVCAFVDARRAWHNVKFLRWQRAALQESRERPRRSRPVHSIEVMLDINTRELGSELISRWGLDVMMGSGAVLIMVGTYMALGGANRKVWLASNLLSGYVGNAPIAVYGLGNVCWAAYMWTKAQRHRRAATEALRGSPLLAVIKRRCTDVQVFFVVNGSASVLGAIGSMLTATQWWAYVILIPVIAASVFCNVWWRTRVGYDRPFVGEEADINTDGLLRALGFAVEARRSLREPEKAVDGLVQPTARAVVQFLVEHDLFDDFCLRAFKNPQLSTALTMAKSAEARIEASSLLGRSELSPAITSVGLDVIHDLGARHFVSRTRFIAEVLGTHLSSARSRSRE